MEHNIAYHGCMTLHLQQRIIQDRRRRYHCHKVGHKSFMLTAIDIHFLVTNTHNLILSSTVPYRYLLLLAFVNKPLFVWIIHSSRWGTQHNSDTVIVSVLNKRCLLFPLNIDWVHLLYYDKYQPRKLFSGEIMAKVNFYVDWNLLSATLWIIISCYDIGFSMNR